VQSNPTSGKRYFFPGISPLGDLNQIRSQIPQEPDRETGNVPGEQFSARKVDHAFSSIPSASDIRRK
jgi:hypothetical protein